MAEIEWDHENTTPIQRLIGVFSIAIMIIILGVLIFIASTKLLTPIQTSFILSVIVAAELIANSWNRWSPMAPQEEE